MAICVGDDHATLLAMWPYFVECQHQNARLIMLCRLSLEDTRHRLSFAECFGVGTWRSDNLSSVIVSVSVFLSALGKMCVCRVPARILL
jgi:hypothetical protein